MSLTVWKVMILKDKNFSDRHMSTQNIHKYLHGTYKHTRNIHATRNKFEIPLCWIEFADNQILCLHISLSTSSGIL